ncbi:MAG TPA: hypothetical protein ENI57_03015 [Ignavibacteria bacterium]|nr:hypothetical protein [Ignavibacteria bacterium]
MRKINYLILRLWDLRKNRKKGWTLAVILKLQKFTDTGRSEDMRQPKYLIASYQYAEFNNFNINYFIGEIKFDL